MTGKGGRGSNDERTVDDSPRRTLLKTIGVGALSFSLAGCNALGTNAGTDGADAGTDTATATATGTSADSDADSGTETDAGSGSDAAGDTAGIDPCLVPEASGEAVETLSGGISDDTTLSGEYLVEGRLSVTGGATLTVDAGTRLTFAQDAQLRVREGSTLKAVGTCGSPVVFTGEQQTRGYWNGIVFDESDQQNELAYAVVEYGGGDKYTWAPAAANLAATRNARVSISHSAFRESAAFGVAFSNDSSVDAFEQNVVTANESGAARVGVATAGALADSSTYVGNDDDVVRVSGGTITDEVEWDAIDARYGVMPGDNVSISGGHLTVSGGATVSFGQDAGVEVVEDGQLTAIGMDPETEESLPITFTGEQQTRGYWTGIVVDESDQVPSRLENVVVEYGGGEKYTWAGAAANVAVARGGRVLVSRSTLRESAAYGFHFQNGTTVDSFDRVTVTQNARGAGNVGARLAYAPSDTGTYTGNDVDVVVVTKGTIRDGQRPTWDAIDVPYRVASGDTVEVQGHLTVAPGATVEFGQDAGMEVVTGSGTGRLTAVGIDPDTEESKPITFTGEQKTRGYWNGIVFDETDRTENQFRNAVVEYGGGEKYTWAAAAGNISVGRGSRVRVDGCTLRESQAYGIAVSGTSTVDSFTQNTVTRNRDGAAYADTGSAHSFSDTGTYTGNDRDVVMVDGGSITQGERVTWEAIDVPYRVVSGDSVEVTGHLTVDPGATVEFGQDSGLSVAESNGTGSLTAVGEEGSPITFTGEQKTAGYWRGIEFDETDRTENKLHYAVVEYGGGDKYTWAPAAGNVVVSRGSRLSMQNSTIRNGAGYGLAVSSDSTLSASGNTYDGNALGGLR
ncbi:hypothetical protein [Haloarchaeobius sp. DT45]|uniref:hypothetical protein n=1 Tax=Haloarchaeobius sp. DT45 TaxID=3446116 RepID=UPI003F6B7CB2